MTANDYLRGEPLLAAVPEAMISMHERYHGRVPATANSLMMGGDPAGVGARRRVHRR